ncbi:Ig-like domain repeat protein [Aeromicrobium sp. UC242_57]|uniref:Ig-like domain-containing protein n=1 Tax=Aeromicrobium sp. UC242_57 TaxID=3374624 RepID=UPI003799FDD3
MTGDFNSYNKEEPVAIIEAAGFVNVAAERTDKETYQFDGAVGSLDHVFASHEADETITGADIWNINSYESVAREYSRFNYNVTDFYDASPFRASDHDPEIVGFDAAELGSAVSVKAPATVRNGTSADIKVTVSSTGEGTPSGEVTLLERTTELASGDLVDGVVTLPTGVLPLGSHVLKVVYGGDADHAGSTATLTIEVLKSEAGLTATAATSTYGTGAVVVVTGPAGATGPVYVALGDDRVGSGVLKNGTARITLDRTIAVGTHQLRVFYAGDASHDPASVSTTLTVAKAATSIKRISVSPTKIVKNRTKPFVTLSVKAAGFTVDGGKVTVRVQGKSTPGRSRPAGSRSASARSRRPARSGSRPARRQRCREGLVDVVHDQGGQEVDPAELAVTWRPVPPRDRSPSHRGAVRYRALRPDRL